MDEIYDYVLIFGGDGTLHYIVNGMYDTEKMEDYETSPSKFILFPCGSGNALTSSISSQYDEISCIENCLYLLFHGTPVNICISNFNTKLLNQNNEETVKNIIAVITFTWGLIADVDIESDFYKMLGETKYIISGINHVIAGHKRMAKLQIKLSDNLKSEDKDWVYFSKPDGEIYRTVILSHIRNLTTSVTVCNDICLGYPGYALTVLKGDVTFLNLVKLLLENNYHNMVKEVAESNRNSPKKSLWIDQVMVKDFRMETMGGRLVVDGEFIHEGRFYVEAKVAPYQLCVVGFKNKY